MIGRRPVTVRRGPGLLGMAARTAVVAGTATAVSGGVQRHQAEKAQQGQAAYEQQVQAEAQAQQAQTAAAPPPPASGGISDDTLAKLQQLADLQKQGVLTSEEFAAQKAKLLGM